MAKGNNKNKAKPMLPPLRKNTSYSFSLSTSHSFSHSYMHTAHTFSPLYIL